jgi:outer membrane protein
VKRFSGMVLVGIFFWMSAPGARAQTFPAPEWFRERFKRAPLPQRVPEAEGLREFVVNGKLRLTLTDAIKLTLTNNTSVRLNQLQYESSRFSILQAYAPFDPLFTSSFNANRSTSPTSSQLQGAQTLSSLSQSTQMGYSQTFQTGTNVGVSFNANKSSSNSVFSTFNPSIFTTLNFSLSQPLLRNRGLFVNRAPIVIARRNLAQSRSNFESQVNDAISNAVDAYWRVVEGRENLSVLRKSLEAAEATYQQNKRALELGALPPLDIYRSESQVATRRVAVIQAEYQLKQLEDSFRLTVGADLDPYVRALDLELIEPAETSGELLTVDAQQAYEKAIQKRPELEALRQQLANDDTSIRVAHNGLQPDLALSGIYSSNGQGGNQIDTTTTPPTVISFGGLGDALSQLGGFNFPVYGFTLQLRLPIRTRAAQATFATSQINKQRDLYNLRSRQQSIRLDVLNAVNQLEQAKLSIAAGRIARDLAQKNLEAEQRKYELGAQTIFFVLDAQTQLQQAESSLVQSLISYQRAVTAVEHATGELLERFRVQIREPY